MTQRDERGLIASAAAGDDAALQRIVTEFHDDMLRVCSYVTRDDALAEEATYAAWAKAWQKFGSVREPASLRPWLVSIAVNEAKRILGKRKRRAEFESDQDPVDQAGGVDPATGVAAIDLRGAMRRLAPDDRALLAMRYGAGFSMRTTNLRSPTTGACGSTGSRHQETKVTVSPTFMVRP